MQDVGNSKVWVSGVELARQGRRGSWTAGTGASLASRWGGRHGRHACMQMPLLIRMAGKRLENNCTDSTRYGHERRAERGLNRGWPWNPVAALHTARNVRRGAVWQCMQSAH